MPTSNRAPQQTLEENVLLTVKQLLEPRLSALHWHEFTLRRHPREADTRLQVRCQESEENRHLAMVLCVDFWHEKRELRLHNIFMPEALRWERLGKRTIKAVFDAANAQGYDLYLIETMPSFHDRLLKRHAREINSDTIQITSDTDLVSDIGSTPMPRGDHEVRGYSILDFLDQLDGGSQPKPE